MSLDTLHYLKNGKQELYKTWTQNSITEKDLSMPSGLHIVDKIKASVGVCFCSSYGINKQIQNYFLQVSNLK